MIAKKCVVSRKEFVITDEDLKFYAKMGVITEEQLNKLLSFRLERSETEKSRSLHSSDDSVEMTIDEAEIPRDLLIGLPTLCPEERQRRRLTWRNERKLYQRKCNFCEKLVISIYNKKAKSPVYCQDCWWSDKWDAKDYGQDFDFSRDFFSQFSKLMNKVPRLSIINSQSQNSIYTNFSSRNKNCYYTFGMFFDEDVHYSHYGSNCKDCLDCLRISHCELCYECIDCEKCYESFFSQNCQNCSDSYFLKNCIGCSNCFGSINLRNKEYYFMNKPYTKEEYLNKIKNLKMSKHFYLKDMKASFLQYASQFPHRFMIGKKNDNILGNFIYNSKNCYHCFSTGDCEDCKYGYQIDAVNSSHDMNCMGYDKSELCYECTGGTGLFEAISTECVWLSNNILYSGQCFNNCSNLFGCVGLKHDQYCILNKQYTKEEYFQLREKIIEHMKKTPLKDLNGQVTQGVEWGEFFPAKLSPFAYNETVAQEYFPLTKEEAEKRGYRWKEEVVNKNYEKLRENFSWANISDDITQVEDDICNQVLFCERSGKPYKIQKAELRFYRKMNLPIPRLHPDERHKDRMALRNPRTLFSRNCADCGCKIQTTFAPDRLEKVLCEKCYLEAVI